MALNLTIREFVIIVLAVFVLILGVFLLIRISGFKEIVEEVPSPFIDERVVEVRVVPKSSQQGTMFLVRAKNPERIEKQSLILNINGENYKNLFVLYDDGKHYDGEPRDGEYGAILDSSRIPIGDYLIEKNGEILDSFIIYEGQCKSIKGIAKDDRINFVILPSGYTSFEEFKEDAEEIISGRESFSDIEPLKSNQDKFSFSVVNTSRDLKCTRECSGVKSVVCCDDRAVSEEASQCHHDSVIVLLNDAELCGSATSYAKLCSKNDLSKLALVHEIGHSFANLADEYTYQNYYIGEINNVNCDVAECKKWGDVTSGCYEGCSYDDLFRSVEKDSIMYTYYPGFNEVSTIHVENVIEEQISFESELEKALPGRESYVMNLRYKDGDLEITDVFLKPIKSSGVGRETGYAAEIRDFDGRTLAETNILVPNMVYPLPGTGAVPVVKDDFEFQIILPYSKNAESIALLRGNEVLNESSVEVFSDTCGNGICNSAENHLSCSEDCSIEEDSFCEESVCDPDCASQENCLRNKELGKYAGVFLIIGAFVLIGVVVLFGMRKKRR